LASARRHCWKLKKQGWKKEAALKKAMSHCGVKSRDKALAACRDWFPVFDKHGTKLKALTSTE
jgi:hypothetical protein